MRSYPHNSPQAAARIVALVSLADDQLTRAELELLERCRAHQVLGLSRAGWRELLQQLREDLQACGSPSWADTSFDQPHLLGSLLDEIDDPELRLKVLHLSVQVAEADARVDDNEDHLLTTLVERWGLQRHMLMPAVAA